MGRLSARDLQRVEELSAPLKVVEDGTPSPLAALLPELGELLQLPQATIYSVAVEDEGYSLAFAHMSGYGRPLAESNAIWDRALRATRRSLGMYTPARPERAQQNVVVSLPSGEELARGATDLPRAVSAERPPSDPQAFQAVVGAFRALGVADHGQLRVLVCEDDALLAWVGGFSPEPLTDRERLLLQAMVPALQKRLSLERMLGTARLNALAVDALLEQLPKAAALVGANGRVHRANAAARALLEEDPAEFKDALSRAFKGEPTAQLTRIDAAGMGPLYLATLADRGAAHLYGQARRRWGLTPRQAEVLVKIASGESNKGIAATLDCAERTIEAHVTQILDKLGVESRSAAVARFWSELR